MCIYNLRFIYDLRLLNMYYNLVEGYWKNLLRFKILFITHVLFAVFPLPIGSQAKGSFRRVFNSRPNLTIRPTSTKSRSRRIKYLRTQVRRSFSPFSSVVSQQPFATLILSSCKRTQCSSMLRWNTAETRNLVICSWLTVSSRDQATFRADSLARFSSPFNLHDWRSAKAASSNWQP